jgi:hypothetical protein
MELFGHHSTAPRAPTFYFDTGRVRVSTKEGRKADDVSRALLLAPPVFVCHFLEESPGFVAWFTMLAHGYMILFRGSRLF